jgi:predicted glycosyltransferase
MTNILIYSQDGFGLGHLRRNLNICQQTTKRCPQATFLLVADSPAAPFFKLPRQCDFVKLPTIVKVDSGVWRPDHLAMRYDEVLAIRSEIIQNVILSLRPEVFLVDHMPHGALGELKKPLELLKKYSPYTRAVLGIRDILGAPDVIHRQWQKEGAFEAATSFYDAICVYGSSEVFDAVTEYEFPASLAAKTHYCGYVCRESAETAVAYQTSGNGFGNAREKLVLVAGGGGADAAFFMNQFIDAFRLLDLHEPVRAIITTGPFMPRDQFAKLRHRARGLPIVVAQLGEDSIRLMRRADLVISMAGYNTISEIMRFKKNAIVIPRPGPSAEQTMRSRIMSVRGLFSTIHPSQLTAASLAELMTQKLQGENGMNHAMLPSLNGASAMAEFILSNGRGTS